MLKTMDRRLTGTLPKGASGVRLNVSVVGVTRSLASTQTSETAMNSAADLPSIVRTLVIRCMYELVGEAYVSHCMDGQMFELLDVIQKCT